MLEHCCKDLFRLQLCVLGSAKDSREKVRWIFINLFDQLSSLVGMLS